MIFDKYRREDDRNDDLGVYRQEEYQGMHIIRGKGFEQPLNTFGERDDKQLQTALAKLAPRERELALLVLAGLSILRASKRMGIRQQTAYIYWQRIKGKLNNIRP